MRIFLAAVFLTAMSTAGLAQPKVSVPTKTRIPAMCKATRSQFRCRLIGYKISQPVRFYASLLTGDMRSYWKQRELDHKIAKCDVVFFSQNGKATGKFLNCRIAF